MYYKLFDVLARRGLKRSDLRALMSPTTIARFAKGGELSTCTIDKICAYLDVQPGDIMEYIPDSPK